MRKLNDDNNYFQDKEFLSSLKAYERMNSGGEPAELSPETLTDIAEYYAMNQRDQEATRCIQYALSFYPDSIDPQIFLARQQMFFGNQKEAWRICNAISDQDDHEVLFLRAELQFRDTQDRHAFDPLFDEYFNLRENNDPDAPEMLFDVIQMLKDYDFQTFALIWAKALRIEYPDFTDILVLEAEMYNKKHMHQKTISLLEPNIHLIPYNIRAWQYLGEAYLFANKLHEALEATDYALAIDSEDPQIIILRANIHYENKELEEAYNWYEKFRAIFPDEPRLLYLEGQCLSDIGNYELAIKRLENFTSKPDSPMHGYAYGYMAYCYRKLGDEEHCKLYIRMAKLEFENNLKELGLA